MTKRMHGCFVAVYVMEGVWNVRMKCMRHTRRIFISAPRWFTMSMKQCCAARHRKYANATRGMSLPIVNMSACVQSLPSAPVQNIREITDKRTHMHTRPFDNVYGASMYMFTQRPCAWSCHLKDMCRKLGLTVQHCDVMTHPKRQDRSRGMATIQFSHPDDVVQAVSKLNDPTT